MSKGYIKRGSKLKEVSLSKSLDMSRATVKGAIKRLVYEGLAEHVPNKGVSVVNPSFEEIKQSFQVRAQLEKMALTHCVDHLDKKNFQELYGFILKEKEIFKAGKPDQHFEYKINANIHLKIAEKSGNRVLFHYIRELIEKTTIYLILFDPFYKVIAANNDSPEEHLRIVRFLEDKEGDKAGIALERHLEHVLAGIDKHERFPKDYLTV